jgi:hypothetical protein
MLTAERLRLNANYIFTTGVKRLAYTLSILNMVGSNRCPRGALNRWRKDAKNKYRFL